MGQLGDWGFPLNLRFSTDGIAVWVPARNAELMFGLMCVIILFTDWIDVWVVVWIGIFIHMVNNKDKHQNNKYKHQYHCLQQANQ